MLGYQQRLDVIHESVNHCMSINQIAAKNGKNERSIRQIIKHYKKTRRINKLLTISAKLLILEKRKKQLKAIVQHKKLKMGNPYQSNICLKLLVS